MKLMQTRYDYTLFFISSTFISNAGMKLAKNKQRYLPRQYSTYFKNETKEQVFLYSWDYVINHDGNEDENEK